ncbi:MAG: aldo/keto reductase [bacterium]
MRSFEWRGEKISQMVLGAAQLGMDYGIANQTGQPDKQEAFEILDEAFKNGVNTIDTAQAYGNSENIIGQWFDQNRDKKSSFNIISKWDAKINDTDQLIKSAQTSVKTLGVPLWGIMIHDEEHLDHLDTIYQASKVLKKQGLIKYLGASVYSVEAAKKAIISSNMDFIQVPCNAWDHRMIEGEVFELAKKNDKLCFVRSVFLQGILIMNSTKINNKAPNLSYLHQLWENESILCNSSKEEFAIEFVKKLKMPLVFGIELSKQLKSNISLLKLELNFNKYQNSIKRFKKYLKNQEIDPRKWKS